MERVVMASLVNDETIRIRQLKHDTIQLKECNKVLNNEIKKIKNDLYKKSIFSDSLKVKFLIFTILCLIINILYLNYEIYYNTNDNIIVELKEEVKTYKADIENLSNQFEEFEINFESCKYEISNSFKWNLTPIFLNKENKSNLLTYKADIDKELKRMELYDNIKKSNDNTYLFFVIVLFIIVVYYKIQLINIEFKTNYQMMKSIKSN